MKINIRLASEKQQQSGVAYYMTKPATTATIVTDPTKPALLPKALFFPGAGASAGVIAIVDGGETGAGPPGPGDDAGGDGGEVLVPEGDGAEAVGGGGDGEVAGGGDALGEVEAEGEGDLDGVCGDGDGAGLCATAKPTRRAAIAARESNAPDRAMEEEEEREGRKCSLERERTET